MKSKNKKIDIDKLMSDISDNYKEIRHGMETSDFTDSEWAEIRQGLEEAELKAYLIKMKIHLDRLVNTSPNLPARDAIIQLLGHLRPDASASLVAKVTKYISEEWEKNAKEAVA